MEFFLEYRTVLLIAWIIVLLIAETVMPFTVDYGERRITHLIRNGVLTAFNFLLNAAIFYGAFLIIQYAALHEIGLFFLIEIPIVWQYVLLFFVYDITLYWWHRFNHTIKLLWDFHQVHHSDPVLDVSSATRFHIFELAFFAVIRLGLVLVFGASLEQMVFFETLVIIAAQFHHSNLKLPRWLDHLLQYVVVTPEMHRIHHDKASFRRNSNYCTTVTWWDKIFGSYSAPMKTESTLKIGLKKFPSLKDVTLLKLIVMPIKYWPQKNFLNKD